MKSLEETFNVGPVEDVIPVKSGDLITKSGEIITQEHSDQEQRIEYDYSQTRDNLYTLLAQGQEALRDALSVARQSEHPRAYEVVGDLMTKLADVNSQLLDLSEKRQKLLSKSRSDDGGNAPTSVTNNAFFVGTPADINKLIKDMQGK